MPGVRGVDLEAFVREQLRVHREILRLVRAYIDDVLREMGLDPARLREGDPSTYWAMVMELARSIFVNWSVERRRAGGR